MLARDILWIYSAPEFSGAQQLEFKQFNRLEKVMYAESEKTGFICGDIVGWLIKKLRLVFAVIEIGR